MRYVSVCVHRGFRLTYGNVPDLAALVAAAASGSAAQTKGWAVGLDVAEALAVVALLSWEV